MLYKEIGVSDETHNTPLQTMHGTNTYYKDTIKVHGYWESTSQYFCYNRSSMFDVTKETIFSPIDTGVKIEYHFNNVMDRTKTEFTAYSIGTEINSFTDYETETLKVKNTENLPLTINDNYNVVKVFLEEIKPELPQEVSYTIINYFDSVADTSKNQTGTALIGDNIIAINLKDDKYEIDNSKTTSLSITITEADQIINIYYKTKTISEPENPDGDGDTTIYGTVIPTIIDVLTTLKLDITINKKDIIANELFITNNGETNIKVSFSGLTNNSTIENVMPSKFGSKEDWFRLGSKNSSKYIALGFNLKENNYKETFKSDIIYFKELEDTSFDLGILQPNKTVSYDIQGSHGVSFKSDIKFNSRLIPMFSLED